MKKLLYIFLVLSAVAGYSQSVVLDASNTTILDAQGTDKTARWPLMTAAQRVAIVNPKVGSMVYDTDYQTVFLFDGQNWNPLVFATNGNEIQLLNKTASDGEAGDTFGSSVSISGDYAIVGAGFDDNMGSAYIFVRSGTTWTQQAKLTASDRAVTDYFGVSVAISGDYAIVGALSDDVGSNTNQGSAYIFVRSGTTWSEQAKLTGDDSNADDLFGSRVSIVGSYAIIGATSKENGSIAGQGAAYIFVRSGTTWTQQAKLLASDGDANDNFGSAVSISGEDEVAVGAWGDVSNSGSAYIFVRSGTTWTQQAKLIGSGRTSDGYFGNAISISGDYVVVGAQNVSYYYSSNRGAAYIFVRSGTNWTEQTKLMPIDGRNNDNFGSSVSISGDYIIVGSKWDDIGSIIDQGSAYIYIRSGSVFNFTRKVFDADPSGYDNFGFSSAITSTGEFLVGAFLKKGSKGSVSFGKVGY